MDSDNRGGSKYPDLDKIQILPDCLLHNSTDQYPMALKEDWGIFSERYMRTAAIALSESYEINEGYRSQM